MDHVHYWLAIVRGLNNLRCYLSFSNMSDHTQHELDALRYFYQCWEDFHAIQRLGIATKEAKQESIRLLIDASKVVNKLQRPRIALLNG